LKHQSQPGLRILLVEDQQALACNIIDYLTAAGHQLDYAATGTLALQLAKQHSYDLVLLDLMLLIQMAGSFVPSCASSGSKLCLY